MTDIPCGREGWGHLVAVWDCHDGEILGWEFALGGRAKEAERALGAACLRGLGTIQPEGRNPVVRSDNGSIFQSRHLHSACRFYRVGQEFITLFTPEQKGMIELFFRSLKEECTWQHNFTGYREGKAKIARWLRWCAHRRPHQALGYRSPAQYRAEQLKQVA